MNKSIVFAAAAIGVLLRVGSCATHPDGRRMTLAEQWHAMAEKQDAAARNFVDTERDTADSKPPVAPAEPSIRNQSSDGPWLR
jgi:hypothetical protein